MNLNRLKFFRSARSSDPRAFQPVWWDAGGNGGFGAWRPEPCALKSAKAGLVWFSCSRMGYYSYQLLKESLRAPDPTKPKFRCVEGRGQCQHSKGGREGLSVVRVSGITERLNVRVTGYQKYLI